MADEKKDSSNGIFDSIEGGIIKYWPWILVAVAVYLIFSNNLQYGFIRWILILAGTIFLGWVAWRFWLHYVQQDFISGIDFVLLEIVPPREVLRSPKAMELFFTNALYHWSQKAGKEEWWQGAVWFWFSLEIVSIDGQVHFYIRTPTRVRSLIETQMYAQYPQAQVKVVEDYTLAVDEITPESAWNGWGCEFKLLKPEAYPLKTYVDYGLDKDPKEEFKVDPISPVIEFFGSLQKGEQAWMQIVITPSKKEYRTHGSYFKKHDWVEESQLAINKMLLPYSSYKDVQTYKDVGLGRSRIEIRPPDFIKKTLEGMVAKKTKIGFDTGIRVMYVAKKEVFDMNTRKSMRLLFRQYANPDSNQLWRDNSTQADAFNTRFFMLSTKKVMILANRMLNEYRERSFFRLPLRHFFNNHNITGLTAIIVKQFWLPYFHPPTFVLNVEELATLWHFPGQILKVPTLERIESKEASPPSNLPI